ncbi:DUF1223 domain-containing protein [Mucilaginibacter sp. HMF5004]|uniref:DUF1223 domain-containing protein n=1 Tax=Mucilaginibacter rivuli TaxID=2857527 RepID=UPI001C5F05FC|nr:DUF1223 domain-containing protein [Mucilaginibacter rivuli]MBW4889419.1 DUF1223 domain-containing protein [Mucilaginibacter rivuli]
MKAYKLIALTGLLLAATLSIFAFKINNQQVIKSKASAENGFAVVELFTSEGCSSCPPADELIARILKEDKEQHIYILAYHVDYWNHLGWKDQFSSAEYSNRQRRYAQQLHLESVYTPQIVVNGRTEFVGSNEVSLRNAIKSNLSKTVNDQLMLGATGIELHQLKIQYQIKGNIANKALVIALVQKAAQSSVKSGENGGHILRHVNIVRELNTIDLNQQNGTATVKLPQGYNQQTWEVICFLQNSATSEILSAQKTVPSNI